MSTIAERIRKLREQKGLSQSEVAKLLGINRTTYVHYETGYSKPTQKLKELCKLFNTTADYIMGTDTTPDNKELNINLPSFKQTESDIQLSSEEKKLIHMYRKLDEAAKTRVYRTLKGEYDDKKKLEQEVTKGA
ncbi:helix-turn-helix domain-containing protein [Megamonas hypermegale]|uniref:helix-turn-helix domain-containing protein n=1 Tax=Megamonas hypermegale TaxID=158847 RepID=UPI0026F25AF6|nr:helix-turn-helix transcriptional regulator [Megamonas hypermegale]